MTKDEAIASLINSCQEYKSALETVLEENAFLTDTIEKHNLGKINAEAKIKQMQKKNRRKRIRNGIISLSGYLIAIAVIILHFIFC